MSENSDKKFCGLQGAHVVVSEYNDNGECICLFCLGHMCSRCKHYRNLVAESVRLDQVKLERCINCMNEAKQK
ncbi:MAG: hypothetical protein IK122_02050 [Alphaproteobacteria bacterium]|nr:hypothetical protein [Alphaproteobacteria bacterium]